MFDSHVTVVGSVGSTPSIRSTPYGPISEFRLVTAPPPRRRGSYTERRSLEITVVARRSLAEAVQNSLSTGEDVIVRGRLFSRRFSDGRHRHEITASAIGRNIVQMTESTHVPPNIAGLDTTVSAAPVPGGATENHGVMSSASTPSSTVRLLVGAGERRATGRGR